MRLRLTLFIPIAFCVGAFASAAFAGDDPVRKTVGPDSAAPLTSPASRLAGVQIAATDDGGAVATIKIGWETSRRHGSNGVFDSFTGTLNVPFKSDPTTDDPGANSFSGDLSGEFGLSHVMVSGMGRISKDAQAACAKALAKEDCSMADLQVAHDAGSITDEDFYISMINSGKSSRTLS